jgi:predicted tellurium resistance membrane protein TerC
VEAREASFDVPAATTQVFVWIVLQLVVIDLVFSLDSILTAIGMAEDLEVMIAAVVIAMIVMYAAANPVGAFIAAHPTTKMLALAFLVLIGVALVADGFEFHIPRGYIYFAMAFSAGVEAFNVMAKRNRQRRQRS